MVVQFRRSESHTYDAGSKFLPDVKTQKKAV
jgi:hypothetical protein